VSIPRGVRTDFFVPAPLLPLAEINDGKPRACETLFQPLASALLAAIKANLAQGLPAMFGFTVYSSYIQASAANKRAIPYPTAGEQVVGGHAVLAVGYNDTLQIKNTNTGAVATTGALLIRNSWGAGWGDGGYGWLPYDYVLKGLAVDWWALISNEWVDTGKFG